jgi:G3E family GTPase
MHHTVKSRIPLDSLFNIRAFSSDTTGLPQVTLQDSNLKDDHAHDHPHEPAPKAHYNDITTILIQLPTLTTSQHQKLENLLQTLLWEARLPTGDAIEGLDILRTKGYFELESGQEFIVQGVTDIFEIKSVSPTPAQEKAVEGKMVFIGRGVGQDLKKAFETYVGLSA